MTIDKSEKFTWLVRVGYFSRAILYAVLGLVALSGAGRIGQGTNGIFQAIRDAPLGELVLWLMVVGLAAYALFRLGSLVFDIENQGSDGEGWAHRIGHGGSAIGHFALAWAAYRFASQGRADGGGAQEAASGLLAVEFGGILLGVLGLAFAGAAYAQAKKAWSGSFMNRISHRAPSATRTLGRIGYAARAAVFVVIAWSLVQAGFFSKGADEVKTLGDAVASLAGKGFLFTAVAAGLLVFGVFSLVLARYRIVPDMDLSGKAPRFRV